MIIRRIPFLLGPHPTTAQAAAARAVSHSMHKEHENDRKPAIVSLRVLVVDDEATFRESFHYVLEAVYGCDVRDADSADRAEQIIDSDTSFDLMFIDVQMPKKDGIQLYQELRAAGVTTSVVLMSALAQHRTRVDKLEVPFFDKALDGGSLDDIIAKHGGGRTQ